MFVNRDIVFINFEEQEKREKELKEKDLNCTPTYTMGNFRAVDVRTGKVVYSGTEYDCYRYCDGENIRLCCSLIRKEE